MKSSSDLWHWCNVEKYLSISGGHNNGIAIIFGAYKTHYTIGEFELIEMRPEVPQEWNGKGLPPIGVECEIAKLCDALSWNKGVIDFYGKEKCIVTFHDGREAAFIRKAIVLRPLKTQQEKDREALEKLLIGLQPALISEDCQRYFDAYLEDLLDNVIAAPKAGD